MKFLIVEDEPLIAQRLSKMITRVIPEIVEIETIHEYAEAQRYINENKLDLCFLDLNLSGMNGFDLISEKPAFDTIITSAHGHKALEAFEFEVLDFVPKPYQQDRLASSLERFLSKRKRKNQSLMAQCGNGKKIIPMSKISFIRGAGNYSQLECIDGQQYLHNASIGDLSQSLPSDFYRIHKSYLVRLDQIDIINKQGGGKYEVVLNSGKNLPVSRAQMTHLEEVLSSN